VEYIKRQMDNYNLYFIKTDKFKTVNISFAFGKEMTKEDQVYGAILKVILGKGTKKYPDLDELCRMRASLYDPIIKISRGEYGLDRIIYLDMVFVNEKYTEKGMNKKSIEFALSYIFEPNVNNGGFDKKTFDIVRHGYIEVMRKMKDNPDQYCQERIWEEMDVYPFGEFDINESIEFAQKLDEKDLYNYYLSLFNENSLDVFIIGNVDEKEITDVITGIVKGDFKESYTHRPIARDANELKVVKDKTDTEQSKLAIGIRYEGLTDFEQRYVSLAYNSILGGGWTSKLNKVVREKNSLCYYIYATRKVSFGISLIKEQMEAMKNDVSEEELQNVKDIYSNALIEIEDSQASMLNNVLGQVLNDTDSIADRKINMDKVTVDDVKAIAKKVKIEVIYLLEGEKADGKENL